MNRSPLRAFLLMPLVLACFALASATDAQCPQICDSSNNTAVGNSALINNTTGFENTATGAFALFDNTTGATNTAIGFQTLFSNTSSINNTAIGFNALYSNTTGGGTAVGSNNVYIGGGQSGVAGENNTIHIADSPNPGVAATACYIAGIFGQTSASGVPVLINSSNQLGTMTSSQRFKEGIKPMDKASEGLFALKPVSFRYKKEIDPKGTSQLGLVAEDVEKVNPDLVIRDKEGKPYSVRYDQVNAMLLNEFLKEHRTVEEQGATIRRQREDFEAAIAQQQKEIEALTATVKEQASQIQKVSAQLELSKSAPQTVVSSP